MKGTQVKVYLVMVEGYDDNERIESVWSTREKANEREKTLHESHKWWWIDVEEWEVDPE